MRYNFSNKKIPFNKTCKDSNFNLSLSNSNNYPTITSNHNYYKKINIIIKCFSDLIIIFFI